MDRKRVDAANTVSILDAWNKSTNNANSSGFTWSYPVSAGTNRLLVVVIGLFDGGTQTISSVTYGGQAMTSAVSISKNNLLTQIFYLNDAGISAASGTNIISTYSGGAQLSYMSAASFQGVNQTTPTASPKTNSSGANVASLGTSTAVNYAAGDYVIVAAAIGNIGTANEFTETAGYTERSDFFLTNGSPLSAAFSVADEAFAGAGSTTPTFTFATQNNPDVVAAIDIQANNINTVYDNSVRLYKAGSLVGNDKAATATLWPTAAAAVTYGTATDLWGQSWTDADFKNAGFGVGISATGTNSTAEIDQIAITVTYIPSASFSSFDMGIQESNGFFKIAASNALGTTDRLTIDASGKVGIGCSTPQYTLHVIGDIASSATVRTTNAVVTGAITACSDVRYKTNIIPLSNSLTNVLKLQGVSYNWKVKEFPAKNFSQAPQVGFIAQDIEKIYPQLVFTDVDGYKSVDYSKLTPMLVEAIKEQQRTIEELKVKLAETTVKAMKYDALELRLGVVESKMNMLSNNFYGEAKK